MNRLLTLASTGLFAGGLAILPVSVFAQPSSAAGTDGKTGTTTQVTGQDGKTAPVAHGTVMAAPSHDTKLMHKGKEITKEKASAKESMKDKTAKASTVKATTVKAGTAAGGPAGTPAKTGI